MWLETSLYSYCMQKIKTSVASDVCLLEELGYQTTQAFVCDGERERKEMEAKRKEGKWRRRQAQSERTLEMSAQLQNKASYSSTISKSFWKERNGSELRLKIPELPQVGCSNTKAFSEEATETRDVQTEAGTLRETSSDTRERNQVEIKNIRRVKNIF